MGTASRSRLRGCCVLLASAAALWAAPAAAGKACAPDWVGTWSAATDLTRNSGLSAGQTARFIMHLQVGGTALRVRLSNALGTTPLSLDHVTLGLSGAGAAAPGSDPAPPASILAGTLHDVTFGGQRKVTVAPGQEILSDPVTMTVPSESDLDVSVYSAAGTGTVHTLAGGYEATGGFFGLQSGDETSDTSGEAYGEPTQKWFIVDGIDVLPRTYTPGIVAFGDSITEGFESTPNADHRYPDFLGQRLLSAPEQFAIVNEGITGNQLLAANKDSPAGLERFARDVLSQTGVREVLMLIGINDTAQGFSAEQVIAGYRKIVDAAHAAGLRVVAGTLTPVGDTTGPDVFSNGSAFSNAQRKAINDWIRTTDVFDGVVDFDQAVRDPLLPNDWRRGYSFDNLHGNDLGYQLMADAVPLAVFGSPGCPGDD